MLWINFLHFYQPANSDIKKATTESYERIIRAIEEHGNVKFSVNIAGCLLARLDEDLGRIDLIRRLKRLALKGKLELVGSASYHPLLPLIRPEIIKEQIQENEIILKKYFGENLKLKGFFLPEMAYSADVAKIVKDFGYEWIILDEISAYSELNKIDFNKTYFDEQSKLKIIFRNRIISQQYAPNFILANFSKDDSVLMTATDAELYGLHHKDQSANFEKALKLPSLKTDLISNFIANNSAENEKIKLINSSWESSLLELKKNQPYALWQNHQNQLQAKLWELADLAQEFYLKYQKDNNLWWSRWHLWRGLASCTWWWASAKDMNHVFGPQAWNPDLIELGANELVRSIRDLEQSTTIDEKLCAEKIFLKIIQLIWEKHWTKNLALLN